jgi:hypothetical protein
MLFNGTVEPLEGVDFLKEFGCVKNGGRISTPAATATGWMNREVAIEAERPSTKRRAFLHA